MSQVVKFIIDKISFDDGKTWSDVHFVDKSKYSPPEIHPTCGHGDVIHFTRDREAKIK